MEFTDKTPEVEGIYWIERTTHGARTVEPAAIVKTDKLNWGSYLRIIFIGDEFKYSLGHAESVYDMKYGELVK